jgi:hypothetical protein
MNSPDAPESSRSVAACPPKYPRSLNREAGWLRTPWSSSGGSEVVAGLVPCGGVASGADPEAVVVVIVVVAGADPSGSGEGDASASAEKRCEGEGESDECDAMR